MSRLEYPKSSKYSDLDRNYRQTSGPGGLKLAEFMACKMGVKPGNRLLDAGCNRGWQSCFLAKEFGLAVVGIDPWRDRVSNRPMIEHLRENAAGWEMDNSVLAVECGLPDTGFASESFDYAYSTTTLEMIRVLRGEEGYTACLKELLRLLRLGGILGLGEPMHLEVELPADLEPFMSQPEFPWKECFRSISRTVESVERAGFSILEAAYAPDAGLWWREYAAHDPFCREKPGEDPAAIAADGGRWLSFGYVIAEKLDRPAN